MASKDDTRYALNGVRIEEVTVVARAGNRERRALRFGGVSSVPPAGRGAESTLPPQKANALYSLVGCQGHVRRSRNLEKWSRSRLDGRSPHLSIGRQR